MLFGCSTMRLMGEMAFIAAKRFSRQVMIIVNSEKINYKKFFHIGKVIELVGRVEQIGNPARCKCENLY